MRRIRWYIILNIIFTYSLFAQSSGTIRNSGQDERYKTDILLIVAHPDDETAIGSYLAKVIYDENKKVSVIYTNRGQGGGNTLLGEQASAMGLIREIEARKAASKFGITNVWFLTGYDTPGQDVFHSLQNLNHGYAIESIVRIIRLTRPEVIMTWMPNFVSGENHGDHQASGVVATEAFDLAGDPTVFPAQVASPRERTDINNFNEGLNPWQSKKIYYFSDADQPVIGPGPKFDISAISKSKKVPYYQLAAELSTPHLTQSDVSLTAEKALQSGDYKEFENYMSRFHLLFGKSVVKCSPDGDVFEGITPGAHEYVRPSGYKTDSRKSITIELGGPFYFYKEFWQAHDIQGLSQLVKPSINVAVNSYFNFPLVLRNGTNDSVDITLRPVIPEGWKLSSGEATYHLGANETFPVQTFFFTGPEQTKQPVDVKWEAFIGGKSAGIVSIRVSLSEWSLPQ